MTDQQTIKPSQLNVDLDYQAVFKAVFTNPSRLHSTIRFTRSMLDEWLAEQPRR